jgi:hypothetical protein
MQHLEEIGPRKQRRRTFGRFFATASTGVAAAILVGVLAANNWLPLQKSQVEQPSSKVTQPAQPTTPSQPGDTHAGTPTTPAQPSTPSTPTSQTATVQAQRAELQAIVLRAKEGKVPGNDFAAHFNMIDQIYKAWGDPDKQDFAGRGMYATYTQRGFAFGVNKGEQLFDVRSYRPEIQEIKLSTVKAELGNPDHLNRLSNPDQDVMIYQMNDMFQLQLIFPHPTTANPDPNLDHISVYCEQDSHNYMAGW